jgi:hypothetical protein
LPEQDVYRGGFLHVNSVSVEDAHMGHDLGLRLLHETFVFLKSQWNLAVMCPSSYFDFSAPSDSDHKEIQKVASRELARIGFQQKGRNADECNAWYLTSLTYFGNEQSPKSSSEIMRKWKTKSQVQILDTYLPPEKHEPTGVDKELANLVNEARKKRNPLEQMLHNMKRLVENQNASIYGSRALWILCANAEGPTDKAILRHLLTLSKHDINRADEYGNCPLHIAAPFMKLDIIQMLLQFGADRNVKNEKGETPIQSLQKQFDELGKFSFITLRNPNTFFLCATELMDNQSKALLIDGWLSPRMRQMLLYTACDMEILSEEEDTFVNYQPKTISECCEMCARFEYIPTKVMRQNPEGFYKSFMGGWAIVWKAILNLLEKRQSPTIAAIDREIHTMDANIVKWNHFVQKGGRIDYALDCLFRVTENVYVDGDDGWEYDLVKDDIEVYPATVLDAAFEVGRMKCIGNSTEANESCRGPYDHSMFEEEYMDDEDVNDY